MDGCRGGGMGKDKQKHTPVNTPPPPMYLVSDTAGGTFICVCVCVCQYEDVCFLCTRVC